MRNTKYESAHGCMKKEKGYKYKRDILIPLKREQFSVDWDNHLCYFLYIMEKILTYVIQFAVVLFAISIHEAAHGWMANFFGDPTAKLQGRITLNPIAHIDLVGTIIFPLLLIAMGAPVFGWAKPVMVNPYNLRNPKRDHMFIAAAGPGSNIIASVVTIIIFIILRRLNIISLMNPGIIALILFYLIVINIFLAIFNLIPIPPPGWQRNYRGIVKGTGPGVLSKDKTLWLHHSHCHYLCGISGYPGQANPKFHHQYTGLRRAKWIMVRLPEAGLKPDERN